MRKFLFISMAVVLLNPAHSYALQLTRKAAKSIDSVLDLGLSAPKACNPLTKPTEILSDEALFNRGLEEISKYQFCLAVQDFYSIYSTNPDSPYAVPAVKALAKAYVRVLEYVLAINELNLFLKDHPDLDKNSLEEIRFEIIQISYLAMKDDKLSQQNQWTTRLMGVSEDQTKDNPLLQNLIITKFIDDFPQSSFLGAVESIRKEVRARLSTSLMNEARALRARRDYQKSIAKFLVILKWGPQNPSFSEAQMETELTLRTFAMELRDPRSLSDVMVAKIINKDLKEITPQVRIELAEQAEASADKVARP